MSKNWEFIEADEAQTSWWRLEIPENDAERLDSSHLYVCPDVKEDGTLYFSFGTTYLCDYYYEFAWHGNRPTLADAKEAAEKLLK